MIGVCKKKECLRRSPLNPVLFCFQNVNRQFAIRNEAFISGLYCHTCLRSVAPHFQGESRPIY